MQVSELLGSFGDNELSPECLDGTASWLKPDCVSIPQSYTSYLAPMASHKLYTDIHQRKQPDLFHTPMVCKFKRHALLAAPQPVFTFSHPNRCAPPANMYLLWHSASPCCHFVTIFVSPDLVLCHLIASHRSDSWTYLSHPSQCVSWSQSRQAPVDAAHIASAVTAARRAPDLASGQPVFAIL